VEKNLEVQVDIITEKISKKMGYDEIPWLYFLWNCLLIYLLCSILVMFYKADFINQTIGCCALYMLLHPQETTKTRFRVLVLGILLSIIYDSVWLYLKHGELAEDGKKSDGGALKGIRTFSLAMAYVSFLVRFIIAIVFWRVSREFEKIVQAGLGGQASQASEPMETS